MNANTTDSESFRYDKMVERALRDVVRQALKEVVEKGLVAEHHFYITFTTKAAGVKIPKYLHEKYPSEMTIVLQHQFYDLKVEDDKFNVMLSFNNVPENLIIPLDAITVFADPSVNFALQFQSIEDIDEFDEDEFDEQILEKEAEAEKVPDTGEVVSLDTFRKKDTSKKKKTTKNTSKTKPKSKPKKKDKDKDEEDKE